jgi:hypothetical protein
MQRARPSTLLLLLLLVPRLLPLSATRPLGVLLLLLGLLLLLAALLLHRPLRWLLQARL